MGVPGIIRQILERYPQCHAKVIAQIIDGLFIDFNPLIYGGYYTVLALYGYDVLLTKSQDELEKLIILTVIEKAREMIEMVNPRKMVHIAIDGPPPRAKMVQQRSRRFRKILENKRKKQIQDKYSCYKKELWDTSNITPGTNFMLKLSKALQKACKERIFGNIEVVLNDASVPGEGEHKFLRNIENLDDNIKDVAIFSNDGDLLILGNRFTNKRNIYILTEPNKTSEVVKKYYSTEKYMYVILPEFKKGLVKELGLVGYNDDRVIYDYMFFSFFGGNDFVRHLPFTMMKESHSFNMLLGTYKRILESGCGYLVLFHNNGKPYINTEHFKEFITILAMKEAFSMRKKQDKYNNWASSDQMIDSFNEHIKDKPDWEADFLGFQNKYYFKEDHPDYSKYKDLFRHINYNDENKEAWKARYYSYFFGSSTKERRQEYAMEYIKSLIFTLQYYLHDIPSWTWYYPYRVAPMPTDIQSALHYVEDINNLFYFDLGEPSRPLEQLMMVLPRRNKILPKSHRLAMRKKKLVKYYPKKFELDVVAGEKFIYSEPILPEIDVTILRKELGKIELSKEEKRRNKIRKKPLVYK